MVAQLGVELHTSAMAKVVCIIIVIFITVEVHSAAPRNVATSVGIEIQKIQRLTIGVWCIGHAKDATDTLVSNRSLFFVLHIGQ